jgi:hypothetical protein
MYWVNGTLTAEHERCYRASHDVPGARRPHNHGAGAPLSFLACMERAGKWAVWSTPIPHGFISLFN